MIPVVLLGLAVGSAVLFLGCNSSNENPHDSANTPDATTPDTASHDATLDADSDDVMTQPETSITPDAIADTTAEPEGSASEAAIPSDASDATAETDALSPQTPAAPTADYYSDLPCAFPASLARDPSNNTLLAACGGVTNALFRSPAIGDSGPWSQVGNVGGYPSHHAQLTNRYHVVNHSMPDGFTILDAQTGTPTSETAFASLTLLTDQQQPLGFTLNSAAGAILVSGKLCIASSNMDHIDNDPQKTTFFPGTVTCMPFNNDGTVNTSAARAHLTSGINTTGMTLIDAIPDGNGDQRFAVLSSSSYVPNPNQQASLDICVSPAMTCTAIPLGTITAQMSPTLTITNGGMILVGVQKPAPRLLGIDTTSKTIALDRSFPEVQNFISAINHEGHVAALSDFGPYGVGGSILFADLNPNGWTGVPKTPINGSTGPAVIHNGKLYQSVTDNAGTNGSIWRIDMGNVQ